MASTVTVQKITLTITSGDNVYTNWIDITAYSRVRLLVPLLPEDANGIQPQYEVSIAQSTPDPVNAIAVDHGTTYTCGVNIYDQYFPRTDIFDRSVEMGANHIKISLFNRRGTTSVDVYLLLEA